MAATPSSSDGSPPPRSPSPPPLPPYPQMIMEAIAVLGEPGGSTQAAVARRIEAVYGANGSLPLSHADLVAAHLGRMAAAGDIVAVSGDRYSLMYPVSASASVSTGAKRGRGRPPKIRPAGDAYNAGMGMGVSDGKTVNAAALVSGAAPRRRGRPPKPRDPLAPAKVPRPRGRPRKNPVPPSVGVVMQDGAATRRLPPPKVRPQFSEVGFV